MVKYDFQLDKNVCFAYWAQSLIQWVWYFDSKERDYYAVLYGSLTDAEQNALQELKTFLQQKHTGFLWLWQRYSGAPLQEAEEIALWKRIYDALGAKFEIVWRNEAPKLAAWQKTLQEYSFSDVEKVLAKVERFFAVDALVPTKVTVKLLFHYDQKFPGGHTKKEFPNLILLNVSNVDIRHLNLVISVLAHEAIHPIVNRSPLAEELQRQAYLKIAKRWDFEYKASFERPSWRHLFFEAVITSIAAPRNDKSYLNQLLFSRPALSDEERPARFIHQRNATNVWRQIQAVAEELAPLTQKYLDNELRIDQGYCDAVAAAWLNLTKHQGRVQPA